MGENLQPASPRDEGGEDIRFEQLVDLADIQRLQDLFADAFGVAALITTPEGEPITRPSNVSPPCGELIRANPEGARPCAHSDAMLGRHNPLGPNVGHCLSAGLRNAGASITVGGRHVANWLIGQVRDESQADAALVDFASGIGADATECLRAFHEIPEMSAGRFDKIARVLFAIANQISNMAYQNARQARLIADLRKAEADLLESRERYREAQSLAHMGHWSYDTDAQRFLWMSEETLRLLDLPADMLEPDYATLLARIHPGDRQRVDDVVAASVASGDPFVVSYRVPRAAGERRLRAQGMAHRDADGRVMRLSGTVMDVTERHLAEEQLQVFQALAEASVDAIGIVDPETTAVLYANRAAHELFACDFAKREMVGLPGAEFWPEEDRPRMAEVIAEGMRAGWSGDLRQKRRDGGVFEANASVFAIGGSDGEDRRLVVIVRDIGGRKQAEAALRTANSKLEAIIDFLPDATFVVDADARVIAWNRAMEAMTGVAKTDILGRGGRCYAEAFYGERRPILIDHVLDPTLDGSLYGRFERDGDTLFAEGETPAVHGGRGAYIWATALPLRDTDGRVIGAIECVRDITDSKRAELALRESEERLRLALEGTSDGIWDWDFKSGRTYFSPRYYTMLGYAPDEFPATYENWRKLLHPDDLGGAEAAIQSYLQGHTPTFSVEFRCRAKDGGWRWILGRGKVVERDAAGAPARLAGSHSDISARKAAEEALRLIQFGVNRSADAVFVMDPQARFLDVNEAACAALGYPREELLRMSVVDIDPDVNESILAGMFQELRATGRLLVESRHRRRDGTTFPVEVMANYVEFGGREYNFCFVRDLTERKAAETALHLTRRAIDAAAMAFEWYDDSGRIIDVNQRTCVELGYSREEMLSKHLSDIDPNFPAERWPEVWIRIKEQGALSIETLHRRKDGATFPVQVTANFVAFEGREYVFSYAQDLTERRRAEETLRLTQFAIDHSSVAFEWLSAEGEVIASNIEAPRALGYSKEEFVGLHVWDYDPDFSPARWQEFWAELKREGSVTAETRHRRKDGSTFPIEVTANHVRFGDKEFCFAYITDISKRKEAEQALLELNATLEGRVHEEVAKNRDKDHLLIQQSRLAAMGEMMGNIAHQWRQPINALSLVLDNIRDAYEFGQLDRDYLDGQVERGGHLIHKMSTTIDDFRNFFRPDRNSQPFSLARAVRDALMIVDLAYAHANIALDIEADRDVTCLGFPNEYAQVVLNLLANAKDAIVARRIAAGRVLVRIEADAREGRLIVADNGGGIPEDVLPKVFDPYFTTREKGTGIGLYMSRMIIENMGGSVEVENAGEGARVSVRVPLADAPPATPNPHGAQP
ncbi:MAG: PAS domain S-box protein [Betaproteobacteria bacterium]|nr:PAS domain S-box protein [Betaproteobacteria bacterium]